MDSPSEPVSIGSQEPQLKKVSYPEAVTQYLFMSLNSVADQDGADSQPSWEFLIDGDAMKNLSNYHETNQYTLEHFCDDDWELLYEHAARLKTWMESTRQVVIELGRRQKAIRDYEEECRKEIEDKLMEEEEARQEVLAIVNQGLRPQVVQRVRELYDILQEIIAHKNDMLVDSETDSNAQEQINGQGQASTNEDIEMVDEPSGAEVESDLSALQNDTNKEQVINVKSDVDLKMESIRAGLATLEKNQGIFAARFQALEGEVSSRLTAAQNDVLAQMPPKIRPVDITDEDIAVTTAKIVNEHFPMFLRLSSGIADFIEGDNTAAVHVHEVFEMPLRTINLLMKKHKISGSDLEEMLESGDK